MLIHWPIGLLKHMHQGLRAAKPAWLSKEPSDGQDKITIILCICSLPAIAEQRVGKRAAVGRRLIMALKLLMRRPNARPFARPNG